MKKQTFFPIFLVLILILFLVGCSNDLSMAPEAPDTSRKTVEQFPVSGTWDPMGDVIDWGRWMTTPSGITHMWDFTYYSYFEGDFAGEAIFVQSGHWSASYTGGVIGDFTLENADILGQIGGLRGQMGCNMMEGWLDGSMAMQGSGGLEGYHVRISIVGPLNGPYTYSGEVTVDARP